MSVEKAVAKKYGEFEHVRFGNHHFYVVKDSTGRPVWLLGQGLVRSGYESRDHSMFTVQDTSPACLAWLKHRKHDAVIKKNAMPKLGETIDSEGKVVSE